MMVSGCSSSTFCHPYRQSRVKVQHRTALLERRCDNSAMSLPVWRLYTNTDPELFPAQR